MSQSSAAARVPTRPIARPAARDRVQQPRLRVVAPAPRRSAGGLALLSVGLLGLGLLVLLLLNISIGKGAYALTELQREQRQLAEDRQALAEQVEAASAPQNLTLNNAGNTPLALHDVVLSGANRGDFTLSSSCSSAVAAGGQCSVAVSFKPTASGKKSATVLWVDTAFDSPQAVPVSGTATP